MDGDSDIDILGASQGDNEIAWWENDGSQNFTKHSIDSNFKQAQSVYAVDVEPDGDVDIVAAAKKDNEIAWWENDGLQQFSKHSIDSGFNDAGSVYSADVNGDGDIDVLGASRGLNEIALWENGGNTTAVELASFSARPTTAHSFLHGLTFMVPLSVVVGLCILSGLALYTWLRNSPAC